MLRVIFCVALLLSGCAYDPAGQRSPRVIVKERVVAIDRAGRSDAEIRDAAVVASQDTYKQAPRNERSCPCHDFKTSDGSRCEDRAARGWVYCSREDVPLS